MNKQHVHSIKCATVDWLNWLGIENESLQQQTQPSTKKYMQVIHAHWLYKLNRKDVSKCIENDTLDTRSCRSRMEFHFWIEWHCSTKKKSQQQTHQIRVLKDATDFYWAARGDFESRKCGFLFTVTIWRQGIGWKCSTFSVYFCLLVLGIQSASRFGEII